jgi:U2 small nuclear ribonucleoprotein B''
MASKTAADAPNAGTPNQTCESSACSYKPLLIVTRLYVKNLNEKINKIELKRALYMLFSTYGPVLDIVTSRVGAKGQTMRGQAHIVYRDIQTSTQAMRALQGFEFFERELVRFHSQVLRRYMNTKPETQIIKYGKGQSHIIPKLRGTFEPTSIAPTIEQTALQKSIFNAPPPSSTSTKPIENGTKTAESKDTPEPHGVKRPREEPEEEEDENEVEMEEDEDDVAMEEDDED